MNEAIHLRISPKHVHYINRIMEGYEYLGTVSTLDRNEAVVIIRTTPDTLQEVHNIISHLDIPFEYVNKKYN
ncbi:DUF4911 domain-containing protein [bacterium BFN5]|nr:DUF4911 domain-containing protein [bacterium BFN5]